MQGPRRRQWVLVGLTAILTLALEACGAANSPSPNRTGTPAAQQAQSILHGPAPGFSLTDQFGRKVSIHDLLGKVVVLAFTDAQCTTICPLTTESMAEALKLLGPAAAGVQLVGLNSNPTANSVADVLDYSTAHGLLHSWLFLTGSAAQLQLVWNEYHIFAAVEQGSVVHTAAVFIIDAAGNERYLYMTPLEYASVPQEAELLAGAAAGLLPSHPHVLPVTVPGHIVPGSVVELPVIGGVSSAPAVTLGGDKRLVVFWASWVPDAAAKLAELNQYAIDAQRKGLPPLIAVDEAPTEPSPTGAAKLVEGIAPVLYPVAIDQTGRVADLYGVADLAWYVLTDAHARVHWTNGGWLSLAELETAVSKASA
ncbi:MAG: SCO family protein [Candidatus Dormibacter sp.]